MPGHDIIVIGASSGGIEALTEVAARLPEDIPAALFVVVHVAPRSVSVLPEILNRTGPLTAAHARDNEKIKSGRIYVAPPDFHMLVTNGAIRLVRGPKENNTRPAIDPTFRTAARNYGARVVGVILSGALDDGASGLRAIKERGGLAVVQDPLDALFPDMPQNALAAVAVDHVLPMAEIAPLLDRLAREPVSATNGNVTEELQKEPDIGALDRLSRAPGERRARAPAGRAGEEQRAEEAYYRSLRREGAESAEQAETIKKLLLSGKLSEPVDKIEERE